jgi:hypothetical protein
VAVLLGQGRQPHLPGRHQERLPRGTTYTYDDASELTGKNGSTTGWSYDKLGNEPAAASGTVRTNETWTDYRQLSGITVGGKTYDLVHAGTSYGLPARSPIGLRAAPGPRRRSGPRGRDDHDSQSWLCHMRFRDRLHQEHTRGQPMRFSGEVSVGPQGSFQFTDSPAPPAAAPAQPPPHLRPTVPHRPQGPGRDADPRRVLRDEPGPALLPPGREDLRREHPAQLSRRSR